MAHHGFPASYKVHVAPRRSRLRYCWADWFTGNEETVADAACREHGDDFPLCHVSRYFRDRFVYPIARGEVHVLNFDVFFYARDESRHLFIPLKVNLANITTLFFTTV